MSKTAKIVSKVVCLYKGQCQTTIIGTEVVVMWSNTFVLPCNTVVKLIETLRGHVRGCRSGVSSRGEVSVDSTVYARPTVGLRV